jgi:mannose-1-phosphate guanylyltransferase
MTKVKDNNGNAISKNVVAFDSKNNLLLSDKKLITALGVNNLILIETPDAILLASKDRVHELKKLLAKVPNKYL